MPNRGALLPSDPDYTRNAVSSPILLGSNGGRNTTPNPSRRHRIRPTLALQPVTRPTASGCGAPLAPGALPRRGPSQQGERRGDNFRVAGCRRRRCSRCGRLILRLRSTSEVKNTGQDEKNGYIGMSTRTIQDN